MLTSSFRVSIITKIEFLGWKKHTPEGYALAGTSAARQKCIL